MIGTKRSLNSYLNHASIVPIRKDKNEEKKEQEKKERNKSINISRFLRPYYKKYSYMDYPFYKTYNKEKNNERDNNEYEL